MPDINWSSLCDNSPYSTSLCDFMFDYNLSQVIQIPTHTEGNILDIVLTNTPEAFLMFMWLPFLLSSLITLLSHFVCHNVPVTSSSSATSLFDYSILIGLDYLSTFSITTLIYCFMMMILILFGSLSRTFSCPPFICMFLW